MIANKKELVTNLVVKAKQVEYLCFLFPNTLLLVRRYQAARLQVLEDEMTVANEEYIQAVTRASKYPHLGCRNFLLMRRFFLICRRSSPPSL